MKRAQSSPWMGVAVAAFVALSTPAAAEDAARVTSAVPARKASRRARIDLSHLMTDDNRTARNISFSDVRMVLDLDDLLGGPLGLHLDGRGRFGWNDLTDDRVTLTEAHLTVGSTTTSTFVDIGRQVVRPVASADVDGLGLWHRFSDRLSAVVFGGLLPHPVDQSLDDRFAGGGIGYELVGSSSTHGGGAMLELFDGELDRFYVTQRSYGRLSDTLSAHGFVIVDLFGQRALLADLSGDEPKEGLDLTSLDATLRYRPMRWLDSRLSLHHHHTLLPNRWWRNWLAEQRRERGFVIDGDEPVGTRISSVRWTTSLPISPALTPYVRLRGDRRHTDDDNGGEARFGARWRAKTAWVDGYLSWRRFFSASNQIASLRAGMDGTAWGAEVAAVALRSDPETGQSRTAWDVSALAWGDIAGVRLTGQYQVFVEPTLTFHTFFAQVGYRL